MIYRRKLRSSYSVCKTCGIIFTATYRIT
ncbi:hypothetical protein ACK4HY_001747 [Campylobacter jejuni]